MTATLDLTETDIFTALRAYLLSVLPDGVEILRSQANQAPEPASPDFVMMTPTWRVRLGTNVDTWDTTNDAPATLQLMQATEIRIQLDVYGPASADNAHLITTTFRDEFAVDAFAASGFDVTPLYHTEPSQKPFINGEAQYENRWVLDVVLQANPVVTVPQDFANKITPALFPADA